jgi:glycosyltransferase involved in cell wall biosynthesis
MKILMVNNFYYNRGGAQTTALDLEKMLTKKGYEVIPFAMHHNMNFDTQFSKYFVSHIDYAEQINHINPISGFKVIKKCIYSIEAKDNIQRLIINEKPDIAHVQNIHHHITPSIFYVLKKYNIPIIWTLHNYVLLCPNTRFLCNRQICERCKKYKYYYALLTRCKKDSFLASSLAAIETIIHKIMKINELINVFISPSKFLRRKFIEYGFDSNKIVVIPHSIDISHLNGDIEDHGYYLYVGRISEEKGIKTLIDATLKEGQTKLKIVGGGPLMAELINYVNINDKKGLIEILGHRDRNEVFDLLRKCRFLVLPSECYESFGYVVLEAFASSKPVVASKIGAISELIDNGIDGFLFKPKDISSLSEIISFLNKYPEKAKEMGLNAYNKIKIKYNPENQYNQLINIYKKTLAI